MKCLPKSPACIHIILIILTIIFSLECTEKSINNEEPPPTEPKATLTVVLGVGVSGTPLPGTYEYDTGTVINYSYQTLEKYGDIAIHIDGSPVDSSGSITMNNNHTLGGSAILREIWRYGVQEPVYYSTPAIGLDGTIYFGTGIHLTSSESGQYTKNTFYAISQDNSLKWSYDLPAYIFTPVIGNNGMIYVQDSTDVLHFFTSGGSHNWAFDDFDNPPYCPEVGQRVPAVGNGDTIYIAADGLYAVNAATGVRIWHYPGNHCKTSPVIGPDGTIYITIGQDTLHAVNANGTGKWQFAFDTPQEMSFACPAIDAASIVYVASEDALTGSYIYAVNPDGSRKWKYAVEGGRLVRSSPAIGSDGTLYFGTKAEKDVNALLIALNSSNGTKKWSYEVEHNDGHDTPDDVYSSPAVGADGLIYFGAETGFFYALNPDGTLNWKYEIRYGINWSSPRITNEGTIYIGTMSSEFTGFLYALKSTSLGYADSPWPAFRHDNRNSGKATIP